MRDSRSKHLAPRYARCMALADEKLIEQSLRACDTLALAGPRNLRFIEALRTANGLATSTDPKGGRDRVALPDVYAAVLRAISGLLDRSWSTTVLGRSDQYGYALQFARE